MKTTSDFLDDLQKKLGVESDYAVGKQLELHRQQISHYRLMKGAFDDAMCIKVSQVLEIDSGYVIACMHHQRAKKAEVRAAWQHIAERMAVAALVVLVVLPPAPAEAATNVTNVQTAGGLYIM